MHGNMNVKFIIQFICDNYKPVLFQFTLPALILIKLHFAHRAYSYTGCPRRNGQNFGRVFLMLNYTDITQNTYIQS